MKYLLLCCIDEKRWRALPEAERDEIMRDYDAWVGDLEAAGLHLASAQQEPSSGRSTVRARGGKPVVAGRPRCDHLIFEPVSELVGGRRSCPNEPGHVGQ